MALKAAIKQDSIYIARGQMFVAIQQAGINHRDLPYRYIGVTTDAVELAVETTTIELENFEDATGVVVREDATSSKKSIKLELANIDFDNLALAFGVEEQIEIQTSGTLAQNIRFNKAGSLHNLNGFRLSNLAVTLVAPAWAASTAFVVGDCIKNTTHVYQCTVAGSTGATIPSFPVNGTTVTDGTVTWTDLGTNKVTDPLTQSINAGDPGHFSADIDNGIILFSDSVSGLVVNAVYAVAAQKESAKRSKAVSGRTLQRNISLMYKEDNVSGKPKIWYMPNCVLFANGSLMLKTAEYQILPVEIKIQKGDPDFYFVYAPTV